MTGAVPLGTRDSPEGVASRFAAPTLAIASHEFSFLRGGLQNKAAVLFSQSGRAS